MVFDTYGIFYGIEGNRVYRSPDSKPSAIISIRGDVKSSVYKKIQSLHWNLNKAKNSIEQKSVLQI